MAFMSNCIKIVILVYLKDVDKALWALKLTTFTLFLNVSLQRNWMLNETVDLDLTFEGANELQRLAVLHVVLFPLFKSEILSTLLNFAFEFGTIEDFQ